MVHPHSSKNVTLWRTATQLVRLKRLFFFFKQQFINEMSESSAKKVYQKKFLLKTSSNFSNIYGGYSPHLCWGREAPVPRCLSYGTSWPDTLHPAHTLLCTELETYETDTTQNLCHAPKQQHKKRLFDRVDGWQKQTWHLTGLHLSLSRWGSCKEKKKRQRWVNSGCHFKFSWKLMWSHRLFLTGDVWALGLCCPLQPFAL